LRRPGQLVCKPIRIGLRGRRIIDGHPHDNRLPHARDEIHLALCQCVGIPAFKLRLLPQLRLPRSDVEIDFLGVIEPGERVLRERLNASGRGALDPILALLSGVQDRCVKDGIAPSRRGGVVGARGPSGQAGADSLALLLPRLLEFGASIDGRLAFERHKSAVAIHGIARPFRQGVVGFLGARGIFQGLHPLKAGAGLVNASRDLLEPPTDAGAEVIARGADGKALLMNGAIRLGSLIDWNGNHTLRPPWNDGDRRQAPKKVIKVRAENDGAAARLSGRQLPGLDRGVK
jgi:hypothetical protein